MASPKPSLSISYQGDYPMDDASTVEIHPTSDEEMDSDPGEFNYERMVERYQMGKPWPEPPTLGYDVSYVGRWAPPPELRPPKKSWPPSSVPILRRVDAPAGWTDSEDDLFEQYV